MKKIFIWICISSLICMNAYAYVIAEPDTYSNNVIIKGCEQGNELMLTITKVGKTIPDADNALKNNLDIDDYVYYLKQFAKNEEKYTLSVSFTDDADGGMYNMSIGMETSKISFSPLTTRLGLIEYMNANVADETSFTEFISANYNKLGINADMYEECTNKTKALGMAFNALNIRTATLKETVSEINRALLTELLNEGKSQEFEYIINAVNFENSEKIAAWQSLITNDGKIQIADRLVNSNFSGFSEVERELLVQMVICEITYPVDPDALRLADTLILKNTYLGLELTKFKALSEQHRAEIINKVKSDKPKTIVDLQNYINKYVEAYTTVSTSSGGSGGRNVTIAAPIGQNINNTMTGIENSNFSDLGGFLWAANYINKLSDMKIISGYEDNTFRPGANVSRAEFITMVSRFLYDNFVAECIFEDVTKEHWAYKYIAAASDGNIIKGSGERFMPEEEITREDIAVILYRVAQKNSMYQKAIQNNDAFTDDSDISDYARDAIYALKSWGIVNGNETGEFKPLNRATRAETSKMIYLFIKLHQEDIK